MYEFTDAHGERVTVRSARTLGYLLSEGKIVPSTPFRRAGEPAFVPAVEHAQLRSIAAVLGIAWPAPKPVQDPGPPNSTASQVEPRSPPSNESMPSPSVLVNTPKQSSVPQVPKRATPRQPNTPAAPAPPEPRKGWEIPASTHPESSAPRIPLATASRPVVREATQRRLQGAWTVAAWLATAVVVSATAGTVVGVITSSRVVGWLVALVVEAVFARQAARNLGARKLDLSSNLVGAVAIGLAFLGIATVGPLTLLVTVPCGVMFLAALRDGAKSK